ncbi:hypothetical protein COU15_02240 [Candidatus Kaiserbacteria bacterium CG10_big_fil_rev_8_21_14_0_10_45_20]|uniref:Prepilin peptidase A24 N-terminal domain-containing protein n=1 Tax=Candidatus Kaiserbacteria bacterium CG10_big_fil_rev_8_21_14_0_10_45_20 TaxID=1974607 RepID=A0A2H0UFK7_9BACT|nr:MAG: hypothetical protein COU15_02240 [Candidatus Kaiserbacteria bacterium CG10_big_fil_rev_8_21_14_0_10_45_20]
MIDIVLPSLVFLFGVVVGSFVNVLIMRFGFTERTRHRSSCQSCATQLAWYEMVPILSYLFLGGKCGHCKSALSVQYPIVETLVGILFFTSWYTLDPPSSIVGLLSLLTLFFFWATFVVIVVYDIRHTLIPLLFAWTLIASAVVFRILLALQSGTIDPLVGGAVGALVASVILGGIVLVTRMRGMGIGDIYIGVALGVLFGGLQALDVLILSFWVGALVGIILMVAQRFSPLASLLGSRAGLTMKSEVPFVPFVFIGAVLGMFTNVSAFLLVDSLMTLFV